MTNLITKFILPTTLLAASCAAPTTGEQGESLNKQESRFTLTRAAGGANLLLKGESGSDVWWLNISSATDRYVGIKEIVYHHKHNRVSSVRVSWIPGGRIVPTLPGYKDGETLDSGEQVGLAKRAINWIESRPEFSLDSGTPVVCSDAWADGLRSVFLKLIKEYGSTEEKTKFLPETPLDGTTPLSVEEPFPGLLGGNGSASACAS